MPTASLAHVTVPPGELPLTVAVHSVEEPKGIDEGMHLTETASALAALVACPSVVRTALPCCPVADAPGINERAARARTSTASARKTGTRRPIFRFASLPSFPFAQATWSFGRTSKGGLTCVQPSEV